MLLPLFVALQLAAASSDDLTRTVTALDTKLFTAYNDCDLPTFSSLLDDNLEFYHDVTGLSVGRQSTVDAIRNNICGKVHRDLIPATLGIYPLNGYGAVETGIHLFCNPAKVDANGHCPNGSGAGRFTELWQNKDGKWKLTRVISYDHCNGCSTSTPPDYRTPPAKGN